MPKKKISMDELILLNGRDPFQSSLDTAIKNLHFTRQSTDIKENGKLFS